MLRNTLGNVPNFNLIVTNNVYDSLGPSTSDYITDCQFCASESRSEGGPRRLPSDVENDQLS